MSDLQPSFTPEEVRAALFPRVEVKSEPLTYRQDAPVSFYQDLVLIKAGKADPTAQARMDRHNAEMRTVYEARERAARRRLDEGGFEYRVTPNTTPGTGGNFAPPLWLNQLFASARHAQRVLADLIPASFDLPAGVSSINLPIMVTGTAVQAQTPDAGVVDQDITDAAGTSLVVSLSGQADVALQMLEQSPPGAHLDWAFFKDLTESYDAQLEAQLAYGLGSAYNQLLGVANDSAQQNVAYTQGSPSGQTLWPILGQAVAQIGDNRLLAQCWLMRTARWAWLNGQEDTGNRPYGINTPYFLGCTPDTPDPVGGLYGFPVFLDDAIPATISASGTTVNSLVGGTQDAIICLRPSDLIAFEGIPVNTVAFATGSGTLSARLIYRNYAAAITNRFTSGDTAVVGTGMAVQSGW